MATSGPPLGPKNRKSDLGSTRFNPWLFFGALTLPAVISVFDPVFIPGDPLDGIYLAPLTGPIAGIHLAFALNTGPSVAGRTLICITMILLCTATAIALSFTGCLFIR